jgi:hypothetical protein
LESYINKGTTGYLFDYKLKKSNRNNRTTGCEYVILYSKEFYYGMVVENRATVPNTISYVTFQYNKPFWKNWGSLLILFPNQRAAYLDWCTKRARLQFDACQPASVYYYEHQYFSI